MITLLLSAALARPYDDALALPVREEVSHDGYSRDRFGKRWADVDGNGCDTRNDILRRDLAVVESRKCIVYYGILEDPYGGGEVQFVRGLRSADVQIDHVVALSAAWTTGARELSLVKRTAFANDPLNLVATDGRLNAQKGDKDAAEWLPPLVSARCEYAERIVAVKQKYSLWVTAPERAALLGILERCP